jgi:hypothetical protein
MNAINRQSTQQRNRYTHNIFSEFFKMHIKETSLNAKS